MTLPSSGAISLNQIHVEAGGSSGTQASLNDADIRGMVGKGSGAQNRFNDYYGVSGAAPVATFKGRIQTTGNGFPNGTVSLSSGTKIVVVTLQIPGFKNTFCTLGGTSMTLAADSFNTSNPNGSHSLIYYLVTSASGNQSITGNGGSGRSVGHIWEITGYDSSTPTTAVFSTTAANAGSSFSETISVSTQFNGVTIGSGLTEDTITNGVTVSNSDQLLQIDLESATNHYSWKDENTPSGTRSYVCTQGSAGTNASPNGTFHRLAVAHWK